MEKPHFDKMIGRKIDYPDTADSFKIVKKRKFIQTYILWLWSRNSKIINRNIYFKSIQNIYLIDKNGIVYGYDTAKKKVAFLRENLEVIYYEGQ